MTTIILYTLSAFLLSLSFLKDKRKTANSVKKSLKAFENIMPQFLGIIMLIGIILSFLKPETIAALLGSDSGIIGISLASILGSITLMPTFVAFSTADLLLKNGAGYAQVAALVSSLTLVGIVTYPLEAKFIGKKTALIRNLLAFIFCFIVAFIMGKAV